MNADKALELARLAYPNDKNLRVAYMLGLTAGANWQKAQDLAEMAQSESPLSVAYANRCFENGKQAMKEQMLKDAVEGEICHDRAGVDYLDYDIARLDKYIFSRFKFGDKVRIIILKEKEL